MESVSRRIWLLTGFAFDLGMGLSKNYFDAEGLFT
jgi:hypothetical protein